MTTLQSADAAQGASTVLHALETSGLPWCLVRPPRDDKDDLDVLVTAADLDRAIDLLTELGLVEEPSYGRGSHRFLVGYDGSGFVEVDLVTRLDFGPLHAWRSEMAEACLERTVRVDGTRSMHPVDEFWATTLHLLVDDGADPADTHRLARLAELADQVDEPLENREWCTVLQPLLPAGLTCRDVVEIQQDHASAADRGHTMAFIRRTARRRCVMASLTRRNSLSGLVLAGWLRTTEPVRQWRGRRGLLVAVLGPDGAGKSTLLERVGQTWRWPHQRIYFGLWPDLRHPGRVAAVLWPLRRPLRATSRYVFGRVASGRGRLVLFDRYVYDAAVRPRGCHQRLKRLYFQVLLRCAPAPDLVVLLDAPGEVLFARKGEMDPTLLDAHRSAVSAHVHGLRGRSGRPHIVTIDATQTPSQVSSEATRAIWTLAAARLRGAKRRGTA